jgi:hypothetical protein
MTSKISIGEYSISKTESTILEAVKKFVEEDLAPISLQVESEGQVPEAIVEKMRQSLYSGSIWRAGSFHFG